MAELDGEAVAALMIQHDYDLRALLAEDLSWDPSDLLSCLLYTSFPSIS